MLAAPARTEGAAGAVFACAKRSQWQQTLCALEDVWPREIRVYSAAVNALARSVQWRAALQVFQDLTEEAQPDVVLFSSLCKACALASRWAQASQLFLEATRSLQPDVILFSGNTLWISLDNFRTRSCSRMLLCTTPASVLVAKDKSGKTP